MTGSLNVVVGITGGIAAYKAVGVIRSFVLAGHSVDVVATEAALRFVGRPTLEAISRNRVHTDLYDDVADVTHVAIGQRADLIVVAPATANSIAKLATGLADDLLGTTVLASTAPIVLAPAMHTEMWQNQATIANIETLRKRGIHIVGPGSGRLTGRDVGEGRMEEPDVIVEAALAVVGGADTAIDRDLVGRRVVVTAGGTREALDPVRFIGNRSSGKQGVAIAMAAIERGAEVTLIGANLDVEPPTGVSVTTVTSSAELHDAAMGALPDADLVIMCAAVADFRPLVVSDSKIKKEQTGERFTVELERTADILASLAEASTLAQTIVGFGAETAPDEAALVELGRAKLERKGCDFIVMNRVSDTAGFGTDRNTVTVLARGGDIVMEASGDKMTVAHRILDAVV